MTWEPKLSNWWTSSWLIHLQVALLVPPSIKMLRCPSLGSGTWWASMLSCTKAYGQSGPKGDHWGQLFDHFLHSRNPGLIGFTHIMERPYTLSPTVHPSVRTRRKAMLFQNFSRLPQAFRLLREESSDWVIEVTWN